MQNDPSATNPLTGRPCKDPTAGPMSVAERGRAYRERKKLAAAKTLSAPQSIASELIQERTDAELQEALRQALTEAKRHPRRKTVQQRLAQIVAEFARRYPLG